MTQYCTNCGGKEKKKMVDPDYALAFAEKTTKRLFIIILVLIFLLLATNIGWLIYDSQFEMVEQTKTINQDINAEQDGDGINIVGGGDVKYGTES